MTADKNEILGAEPGSLVVLYDKTLKRAAAFYLVAMTHDFWVLRAASTGEDDVVGYNPKRPADWDVVHVVHDANDVIIENGRLVRPTDVVTADLYDTNRYVCWWIDGVVTIRPAVQLIASWFDSLHGVLTHDDEVVVVARREARDPTIHGTITDWCLLHSGNNASVAVRWDDPECGQPSSPWAMLMRDGPKVGMRVHTYDGDQFVYPTPASDAGVGSATTTTETTTEGGDR